MAISVDWSSSSSDVIVHSWNEGGLYLASTWLYLWIEKILVVVWISIDRCWFGLDGIKALDEFHQRRQLTLQQIKNVQVVVYWSGLSRIVGLLNRRPKWNLQPTPISKMNIFLAVTSVFQYLKFFTWKIKGSSKYFRCPCFSLESVTSSDIKMQSQIKIVVFRNHKNTVWWVNARIQMTSR